MSPKPKEKKVTIRDGVPLEAADVEVIIGSLRTAIESYDTNEKTFRQVAEDIRNGKDAPMFTRGAAGVDAALGLAENAFKQAEAARDVLERLTEEE